MRVLSVFAALLALPAAAQAQSLDLLGVCPGTMNISLSGLTPNGQYAIITSDNASGATATPVPGGPCAGAYLNLDPSGLKLRLIRNANGSGNAALSPSLPANACGLAIQALDLTTCLTTNFDFLPTPVTTTTITDVQLGAHAEFDVVNVTGVITAKDANGVWMQENGPSTQYGGIYVFMGADYETTWFAMNRGDIIQVQGEYREYFDLTEISVPVSASRSVVAIGTAAVPSPAVVTLAQLATDAEAWEGVLVRVNNTTVDTGINGFGEWTITDGANIQQVDDVMYDAGTGRNPGDPVGFIQGPLGYSFSAYEILPRDAADAG